MAVARVATSGALATPRMVLVDLDGTMVDSVPDLVFCLDGMMTAPAPVFWNMSKK